MKILISGQWRNKFLDYYRHPNEHRIQVLAWQNLEEIKDLYFVREKSFRLIWNYCIEIGIIEVVQKIVSRFQERYRNTKFISYGLGKIIESANNTEYPVGTIVAFIAPNHPACIERVVLPSELIMCLNNNKPSIVFNAVNSSNILYQFISHDIVSQDKWWKDISTWNRYSGQNVDFDLKKEVKSKLLVLLDKSTWQNAEYLFLDKPTEVKEIRQAKESKQKHLCKSAVLFGYGNYAKTNIIPKISSYVNIKCIHEIDPVQIPMNSDPSMRWDTSPMPRSDEEFDIFLIAGFHHTHTPIAIHALNQHSIAVVEKPIVTSYEQLSELISAMQNSKGQLFSGFHKRYLPFNEWALEDLAITSNQPISYHCIVYEVPLPKHHWYRWPNSRSRLVSNGCHWLDHFLYLNNFCQVKSFDLVAARDGSINSSVTLENGAFFTMVLTDKGSERIGVQDYIELRSNNQVTVKMINGSKYISENNNKVLRKKKINKMQSYKLMYKNIGQKILYGESGDSIESVKISAGLNLDLESKLEQISKEFRK